MSYSTNNPFSYLLIHIFRLPALGDLITILKSMSHQRPMTVSTTKLNRTRYSDPSHGSGYVSEIKRRLFVQNCIVFKCASLIGGKSG